VVLALGTRLVGEQSFSTKTQHARDLLPTLAKLYEQCSWPSGEADQCYVSIGPGSFTGLRVAVAFARHLALAAGVRLCAVPTLDVIATNALSMNSPPLQLAVILDAKRGQVFGAIFDLDGTAYRRQHEPQLIDPASLLSGGTEFSVMGEGIDYHRAAVEASGASIVDRELWTPRAAGVHQLGLGMAEGGQFTLQHELVPFYLRRPEAEEVWEKKQIKNKG
jgi:tRNA threonylcarbamoyladenosine biosynthesis protein TsaB